MSSPFGIIKALLFFAFAATAETYDWRALKDCGETKACWMLDQCDRDSKSGERFTRADSTPQDANCFAGFTAKVYDGQLLELDMWSPSSKMQMTTKQEEKWVEDVMKCERDSGSSNKGGFSVFQDGILFCRGYVEKDLLHDQAKIVLKFEDFKGHEIEVTIVDAVADMASKRSQKCSLSRLKIDGSTKSDKEPSVSLEGSSLIASCVDDKNRLQFSNGTDINSVTCSGEQWKVDDVTILDTEDVDIRCVTVNDPLPIESATDTTITPSGEETTETKGETTMSEEEMDNITWYAIGGTIFLVLIVVAVIMIVLFVIRQKRNPNRARDSNSGKKKEKEEEKLFKKKHSSSTSALSSSSKSSKPGDNEIAFDDKKNVTEASTLSSNLITQPLKKPS